jgi:hypothetical protein
MTDRGRRRGAGSMLAALGLMVGLGASNAAAQVNPVLVELYTSQGCAACPPSDEAFAALVGQPGVIALALHVDYWDYLGWQDVFAQPGFTQRQKRYARAAGAKMIYTPQAIVAGTDRLQGIRPDEIGARIAAHAAQTPRVRLRAWRDGGVLHVEAVAEPPLDRAAEVQLVRYREAETVRIERGENAGREVTYVNIVTEWAPVAEWPGAAPLALSMPLTGDAPAVVVVQEAGLGPVLAAAEAD